jgi:hypothetical protein
MKIQHGRLLLTAGAFTCALTGLLDHSASALPLRHDKHQMPVTAVGCLQREKDYRQEQGKHDGGFLSTGNGESNEYVLVDAIIGGPSLKIDPATEEQNSCIKTGTGQAYELTGPAEHSLEQMVGRRVVINGRLKHAKHDEEAVGTSGTFVPIPETRETRHDLELREINVDAFSLAPLMQRAAPPAEAIPEPAPIAAEPVPEAAAPQEPAAAAPAPTLPKTASPMPLVGLIGLLSLLGAIAFRGFDRARS